MLPFFVVSAVLNYFKKYNKLLKLLWTSGFVYCRSQIVHMYKKDRMHFVDSDVKPLNVSSIKVCQYSTHTEGLKVNGVIGATERGHLAEASSRRG